jgi:hypothetical protein
LLRFITKNVLAVAAAAQGTNKWQHVAAALTLLVSHSACNAQHPTQWQQMAAKCVIDAAGVPLSLQCSAPNTMAANGST